MGYLVLIMAIGIAISTGAIWGIVALTKRWSDQPTGVKVLVVAGTIALSLLALTGVFMVGCSAIMIGHK